MRLSTLNPLIDSESFCGGVTPSTMLNTISNEALYERYVKLWNKVFDVQKSKYHQTKERFTELFTRLEENETLAEIKDQYETLSKERDTVVSIKSDKYNKTWWREYLDKGYFRTIDSQDGQLDYSPFQYPSDFHPVKYLTNLTESLEKYRENKDAGKFFYHLTENFNQNITVRSITFGLLELTLQSNYDGTDVDEYITSVKSKYIKHGKRQPFIPQVTLSTVGNIVNKANTIIPVLTELKKTFDGTCGVINILTRNIADNIRVLQDDQEEYAETLLLCYSHAMRILFYIVDYATLLEYVYNDYLNLAKTMLNVLTKQSDTMQGVLEE